jgi:hypothetical protein
LLGSIEKPAALETFLEKNNGLLKNFIFSAAQRTTDERLN